MSRQDTKRGQKRSRDEGDDESEEFYGFASDSFVFQEPMEIDEQVGEKDPQEGTSKERRTNFREESDRHPSELRRSNRLKKAKQDFSYVYF